MPKYRLLTYEELQQLEGVFINFLAAQSITAQDWDKIKKQNKEKMNKLIAQFSDVVFEKTLSNVTLLEERQSGKILMYKFDDNNINLLGFEVSGQSPVDFKKEFNISQLQNLFNDDKLDISFIVGTKPFSGDRKTEIFNLMQTGAMISQNTELWEALVILKRNYEENT